MTIYLACLKMKLKTRVCLHFIKTKFLECDILVSKLVRNSYYLLVSTNRSKFLEYCFCLLYSLSSPKKKKKVIAVGLLLRKWVEFSCVCQFVLLQEMAVERETINNLVFAVNGERFELSTVDPSTTLLEFLRSRTRFKSVKLSCGEGSCARVNVCSYNILCYREFMI